MGSKQALSNGNEPAELTDLVNAFQLHNDVHVEIEMHLRLHGGALDLLATATAYEMEGWNTGAELSALAKSQCWGHEWVRLMGLYTTLLYRLDFELGEREWRKLEVKKA